MRKERYKVVRQSDGETFFAPTYVKARKLARQVWRESNGENVGIFANILDKWVDAEQLALYSPDQLP